MGLEMQMPRQFFGTGPRNTVFGSGSDIRVLCEAGCTGSLEGGFASTMVNCYGACS